MKTTEMLKQIKTLLKVRIGLAQQTLEDGETIIEAESFAAGEAVFIVSDDERIALPIGEYTNSDGNIIVVSEEGIIAEIKDALEDEDKKEDEAPIEEEQLEDEEIVVDVPEAAADEVAAIVEAVVEVIAPVIAEVKEQVEELKRMYTDQADKKEKMSKQKPARKPMKHNPETKTKEAQNLYSQNAGNYTTKDRVFNKLFNN